MLQQVTKDKIVNTLTNGTAKEQEQLCKKLNDLGLEFYYQAQAALLDLAVTQWLSESKPATYYKGEFNYEAIH